jgi:hypothetical protein
MDFKGIQIRFYCKNGEQYKSIGLFLKYMSEMYHKNALKGVGYNWHVDSFDYIIWNVDERMAFDTAAILKQYPTSKYITLRLPDEGWQIYQCSIDNLENLYGEIYKDGALDYEIEEFDSNGNCKISVLRLQRENKEILSMKIKIGQWQIDDAADIATIVGNKKVLS